MAEGEIADVGFRVDSDQLKRGTARLGQFRSATVRADRSSGSFTRTMVANGTVMTRTNGAVSRLAGGLGRLAGILAVTFGAGATVRSLANFEGSMSQVAAITRATTGELEAMNDIAKQLGGTTEFSASQAAGGLKFLGMAGFTAAQSIEALPQVLDLATAAAMELSTAADITSNIMSAFGIASNNTSRVTDVLAAASSRANTDVSQLGDAIKFVGPIASAVGLDIGEAAAAIGTLSDAGLQGSMAGTGLRRIISSLANPTKDAISVIEGLGISIETLNPATVSIVDIIEQLAGAGLSAADALTIFGDRGGPAILALVQNRAKLAQLTETLRDVEGEATRMATTMRDNLQGDLRNVASAAEAVTLSLGSSGLTDVLRTVAQAMTEFLRAIANNGDVVLSLITAIAAALGVYATAALGAAGATGILSAAIAVLTGPVGLAALAIGGIVGAFVLYKMKADDAGQTTIDLANAQVELDRLNDLVKTSSGGVSESFVTEASAAVIATKEILALAQAKLLLEKSQYATRTAGYDQDSIDLFFGQERGTIDALQSRVDELIASTGQLKINLFRAADKLSMEGLGNTIDETSTSLITYTSSAGGAAVGIDQMTIANDNFNTSLTETNELYDTARSGFAGFFEDLRTGLRDGKSLVDSLSNAFGNYLDKIASKALEMAANGIWDMIFGAISGGLGSFGNSNSFAGGLSSLIGNAKGGTYSSPGLSAYSNTVVSSPTVFPFAQGGSFGVMGEAGAEAIMPLTRGSNGDLGVKMQGGGNDGGFVYNDNRKFNLQGTNLTQGDLVTALKIHDDQFNQRIERYKNDPRARTMRVG